MTGHAFFFPNGMVTFIPLISKQNIMSKFFLFLVLPFFTTTDLFCQVYFSEVSSSAGVQFTGKNYGAAVADYDKDGWDDIFAISKDAPCRLYHNNADGTFTDLAPQLGLDYVGTPSCAGWADVNNDGWLDLLITNRNENNKFFLGNEDGTFTENTFLSGLVMGGKVRALLFADVNMDGNIDIYLARLNLENILYLNTGDGKFINFTAASGTLDNQLSMGAVFFDYDNDGDPDLYLTHDANQPFILYQNDGNGYFTDVSAESGADIAAMGMGVDFGDINNDGWLDIYVTNLYDNSLLLNNGNGTFSEMAAAAGVNDFGMGWGCSFLDIDNDGWQDIYAVNDSYFSSNANVLYHNRQDNTFNLISEGTPMESMEPSYGFASTDFNNDGKMDIYLANYVGSVGNQLFKNSSTTENNWVKIKAEGTASNRAAIGTRVTIEANGLLLVDEIAGGSGYASQNSFTLHFGLGEAELIDKLTIHWPNGLEEVFENLEVNTTYSFTEGEGFVTSVKDIFVKPDFGATVLPNPVSGVAQLYLELEKPQTVNVIIFDALGKQIERSELGYLQTGKHEFEWDVSALLGGLYYMKIEGDERAVVVKWVK